MSRILDRYIFTELLSPFLLSLSALSFIVFTKEMLRLVELLLTKGAGLWTVLKIIFHLLPSFLVLTLPIAYLIASITTFSRLSLDKELVAMRAAGISLLRISVPVIFFSCFVFILTFILSEWGQPWSNTSIKRLALSLIQDRLTLALDMGVFNEPIPGMIVYIPDSRSHHETKRIFISDKRDQKKPVVIVADTLRLLQNPGDNQLGIRLFRGTIHQIPNDITQHHQVKFTTYDLKMDVTKSLRVVASTRPRYQDIIKNLDRTGWTDSGYLKRLMEYYKDLAFPVAVLILGVLGVPVGIASKRSGNIGGFAIGVILIVIFYILNVLGEFLVTALILHPFAGAWLPNLILLITTVTLFYRESQR